MKKNTLKNVSIFSSPGQKITLKSSAHKFELKWSVVSQLSKLYVTPHLPSKMAGITICRKFIQWRRKQKWLKLSIKVKWKTKRTIIGSWRPLVYLCRIFH